MDSELRIAYLTSAYARPSDTFIRNEVNELRRLGATVDTYSIRRPAIDETADDDVVAHQKSTHYILDAGLLKLTLATARMKILHPVRYLRAARLAWRTAAPGLRGLLLQAAYLVEASYLASKLLARKTQILHNHIGENSATVAMLASEISGIPSSLTIHGPYIFYAPRKWALSEKLSRASFTACISHFCRGQCQMFAPPSAWRRLHVVRCSVQPLFIEEPPPRRPREQPHFVCVARLCIEKGQRSLIEATRQLVKPSPYGRGQGEGVLPNVRITLIGDGPDRGPLEQAIKEAGLQNHITILGWQSSRAIRETLLGATALVIPSMAEGLPIVAMEALATRCPVIATNIAAMSELIEPGKTGWLIPSGSAGALAAAMQEAANCTNDYLQQMGEAGRARVLDVHHPTRQTEKLKSLLQNAACSPLPYHTP
jgi:colanic acid/amylovoran biosynthesis glycosyltransferase